ncbi:DNA replication ATP-dependent helicase/nuclease DNA2 [Drosophila madeirensis]|uniref:DNA replication ATP-dependent helicase/nuclease n=1 Tax=Drosophila madeirensis TaxID=30013 RepID=A0AAU9G132_DROMD
MSAPPPTSKRVLTPSKENVPTSPNQGPAKKVKSNSDLDTGDDVENKCGDDVKNDCGDDEFDKIFLAALDEMEADESAHKLDLSTWQRCVIEELEMDTESSSLLVKLLVKKSPEVADEPQTAKCHVHAPWNVSDMKQGDIVSLLAKWQPSQSVYVVDKKHGFCVTNPDFLISGTTVTGALFCRRKAVLQERFRGLQWNNRVMVVGTLVHELFQRVLTDKTYTRSHVLTILKYMLQNPYYGQFLYGGGITHQEITEEMQRFVNPIVRFANQFLLDKIPTMPTPTNFRGRIVEVKNTEENLWVPQLGLKGKVDVSVSVNTSMNPIPLELKTGRSTFSIEHTGQLILYQMMNSALGVETSSGLLLYLRENMMREIFGKRNEMRDLIMMRNELAKYLVKEPTAPAMPREDIEDLCLPGPISHHSACQTCQFNTVCAIYAKRDTKLTLGDSHSMKTLMPTLLAHLTDDDIKYFHSWCGVLALEDKHSRESFKQPTIWTEDRVTRQKQGRAIITLRLYPGQLALKCNGRYEQSMQLPSGVDPSINMYHCGFDVGEYVIVSTDSCMAVAAGNIVSLESRRLTLALDRDLKPKYENETFTVDKHDSTSFSSFNYTSLALLLAPTERAKELRSIIVALERQQAPDSVPCSIRMRSYDILRNLNNLQKQAILRCFNGQSYFLIKGLPGTGKTQTLVALVRVLHMLELSVLITAHTHSAVDNLMGRLMEYGLPMVRLGQSSRIAKRLQDISEESVARRCSTVDQLADALETPLIVGVTCLGMGHPIFRKRTFDFCIVDEATQVLEPTILRPLFHCNRFVLVGDPEQLPPIVKSREARNRGADVSLFDRLDSPENTAVLSVQYRMNSTINRLANLLTYEDELQCANHSVARANLQLYLPRDSPLWVRRALSQHLDMAVVVLNTDDVSLRCQNQKGFPYTNTCEVGAVMDILLQLKSAGFNLSNVGVIAPYRAQVELLRQLGESLDRRVEFNTVDQYQGRDKSIIIYSCTRTGREPEQVQGRCRGAEILEDKRRLTVAITRAKHKLIILGDVVCLQKYNPFDVLFSNIPESCFLTLSEGNMDFEYLLPDTERG